ncbi:MAG: hypothetical protein ABID40_01440 [Candidatus Bipolaricaulota bacterium]
MRGIAFLVPSLFLIAVCAGVAPVPIPERILGGGLLLALWAYGLWRAGTGALRGNSPIRLLPGHALLFLALGLVGAQAGLWAWLAVPPLTVVLDLAQPRSLALAVYAILWLDLFALLHQVVALGRDLSGSAFALWSVGIALFAILYVANGARRLWKKGVVV